MKKIIKKSFVIKSVAFLVGIIALILLLNNLILPWYVSSPETVVPNIVGMDKVQASKILEENNLQPVIGDTTYDASVPKDAVMLQKPGAGETVKTGRRIYLYISGGDPVVSVPALKGKSLRDAKFALERLGLSLGQVEDVPSDNPKDMIFDQQYAPGTPLKKGETVGVTMSIGNNSGLLIVPDLIGKSLTEAQQVLADSSLNVGKINYQSSYSLLPNTVVDQYPSKGSRVNNGAKIDLFVTKNSDSPNN
ncbi:MAG: PASTA domain-containing protein [Ignavibacteriaceae bacterium]